MKAEYVFGLCKLMYCVFLSSNKEILSDQQNDEADACTVHLLVSHHCLRPPPSHQRLCLPANRHLRFSPSSHGSQCLVSSHHCLKPPPSHLSCCCPLSHPCLWTPASHHSLCSHTKKKPWFLMMKNHSLLHLSWSQSLFLMSKMSQFYKICLLYHYTTSEDLWMSMIFLIILPIYCFCMYVDFSSSIPHREHMPAQS